MIEYNTKILSLNINGLNNPVKRQKIMTKLRKDKSQIIFLQETHLSSLESEKLKRFGYTNSFHSSFHHGCRRGVIILIRNSVNFECIKKISDKEGRFVIVKGKLENEMVTLVNVNAVLLEVNLKMQEKNTLWRLNVWILNNNTSVEELKKDILTYQNENDNGEVNPAILWDALKAVIRGKLIAKTVAIKKNRGGL